MGPIYKISYDLSYEDLKFILRSTYDSDLHVLRCHKLIYKHHLSAFGVLTLMVGWQEGHPAWRKQSGEVTVWLSVCSKVQTCIWASWCHCHSLSLASVKSRLVLSFWYRLTRVVLDKGPLNGCMCISDDLTTLQVNCTKKSPASFVMVCKQEEKYSLESTDPRESEIRVHLRP